MPKINEKLQLLKKNAHSFNENGIEWALGASLMLYLKGIVPDFHDIDLMISMKDADKAKEILSEMGKICPPNPIQNPIYHTKRFMEFVIDSIDVDLMAGFIIEKDSKIYDCSLHKNQIVEEVKLDGESIPLQSPLLWSKYYHLMGRDEKGSMIEKALSNQIINENK